MPLCQFSHNPKPPSTVKTVAQNSDSLQQQKYKCQTALVMQEVVGDAKPNTYLLSAANGYNLCSGNTLILFPFY